MVVHGGKVFDIAGGNKKKGANLHTWALHGGWHQQWRLRFRGGGWYNIVAAHSGKCLDVWQGKKNRGQNIIQWDCHNGGNQKWHFQYRPY